MPYSSGDYYLICGQCGLKKLRSEVVLDEEINLLVCRDEYDGKHPNDTAIPPMRDPRELPKYLVRPEGTDSFRSQSLGNWEDIALNWEDVDKNWEDGGGETYEQTKSTL